MSAEDYQPDGGLKRQVLLVEDELTIALDMQSALEEAGIAKVHVAGNVEAALELLSGMETPAAAVLDVNLASGTSLKLAAALRERGVPFAFVTAYGTQSGMLEHFVGVPVLAKPFEERDLLRLVRSLLSDGRGAVEGA